MKWFDDWFAKKSKEAWENNHQFSTLLKERDHEMQKAYAMGQAINKMPSSLTLAPSPNTQSINFQIYPATGGHVVEVHFVETNSYLVNGNVPQKSLHIIPSTEDLGIAISKIITLEMLKK
jgi:hypothetical protein